MLAAIGLYGVTAYSVAQRTNEIGVRMALGADRGAILKMVLRGAFLQAGIGLLIGMPAAILAGHFMAGQLYGVKPWDAAVLVETAVILGLLHSSRPFCPHSAPLASNPWLPSVSCSAVPIRLSANELGVYDRAQRCVERCMADHVYDCVVIGAGVRLPPNRLALFEAVVNAVHRPRHGRPSPSTPALKIAVRQPRVGSDPRVSQPDASRVVYLGLLICCSN